MTINHFWAGKQNKIEWTEISQLSIKVKNYMSNITVTDIEEKKKPKSVLEVYLSQLLPSCLQHKIPERVCREDFTRWDRHERIHNPITETFLVEENNFTIKHNKVRSHRPSLMRNIWKQGPTSKSPVLSFSTGNLKWGINKHAISPRLLNIPRERYCMCSSYFTAPAFLTSDGDRYPNPEVGKPTWYKRSYQSPLGVTSPSFGTKWRTNCESNHVLWNWNIV